MMRINKFFKKHVLPHRNTDKNILLVCHKGTCNVISAYVKGWPAKYISDRSRRMEMRNTAYSIYNLKEDAVSIVRENIDDHLYE